MSMKNLIGNKNVSGTSLMGDDVKVSHKSVDVAYPVTVLSADRLSEECDIL